MIKTVKTQTKNGESGYNINIINVDTQHTTFTVTATSTMQGASGSALDQKTGDQSPPQSVSESERHKLKVKAD